MKKNTKTTAKKSERFFLHANYLYLNICVVCVCVFGRKKVNWILSYSKTQHTVN